MHWRGRRQAADLWGRGGLSVREPGSGRASSWLELVTGRAAVLTERAAGLPRPGRLERGGTVTARLDRTLLLT